ncbi:MAG: methionine--tRNA ligase subunit beta [Desulfobacterota bacterium]|nr:methionine--tRNA ligase subunit beta [Thermodesulfobacteriota bacterium]MDW8001256.1 methionine--tRNA ligase subunit beta [Deltaproteobacteria bacterium]
MDYVSFDEFKRLDLRVGKIVMCEEIKGSDRLYKITVDIGEERVIVAGIKPYYKKEELIGKTIVVLKNLEPKRLRGVLSEGMLLAALDEEKSIVSILTVDREVPPGTKVS